MSAQPTPQLPARTWVRWYVSRTCYAAWAVVRTLPRLVAFTAAEAFRGRTVVSCVALSVEEENRVRLLREQVSRFSGLPRVSLEELLTVMPLFLATATRRAPVPTRTDIVRALHGRRRFRPVP